MSSHSSPQSQLPKKDEGIETEAEGLHWGALRMARWKHQNAQFFKNQMETKSTSQPRQIKICPQPNIWAKVHRKLDALASKNGWAEPPVPLILAGWGFSSDEEKKQRWAETVDWCELNGCSDLIAIPNDDDWYMVFE